MILAGMASAGMRAWSIGQRHFRNTSDAAHGGTRVAFEKALAWRNATEKILGKPRTDRVFAVAGQRSPTGIPGVYQEKRSYVVAWTPEPGKLRREFISIAKHGREEALRRAIALRRKREREVYGRAVSDASASRRRALASARTKRRTPRQPGPLRRKTRLPLRPAKRKRSPSRTR